MELKASFHEAEVQVAALSMPKTDTCCWFAGGVVHYW